MKNTPLARQVFREKVFSLNLSLIHIHIHGTRKPSEYFLFLHLSAAAVENLFDFVWVRYL